MKNNILPLAIGLILAVASIFMLRGYLEEQKAEVIKAAKENVANLQANQVAVFVARKPIAPGAPITSSMVDTTVASRDNVNPNSVRYFSELEGKAAARAISPGEQITTDSLRIVDVAGANGTQDLAKRFSAIIPEGKRAIGIVVDNIASILDMVKPGDHADIIGIIEMPSGGQGPGQLINVPIFQDVVILAVGNSFNQSNNVAQIGSSIQKMLGKGDDKNKGKPGDLSGTPPITVALEPEEATVVSFVQEKGKLRLALRAPGDVGRINYQEKQSTHQVDIPPVMDFQSFYAFLISRGLVAPPAQRQQPEEVPEKKIVEKKSEVKIYRGDKAEIKELIK